MAMKKIIFKAGSVQKATQSRIFSWIRPRIGHLAHKQVAKQ